MSKRMTDQRMGHFRWTEKRGMLRSGSKVKPKPPKNLGDALYVHKPGTGRLDWKPIVLTSEKAEVEKPP